MALSAAPCPPPPPPCPPPLDGHGKGGVVSSSLSLSLEKLLDQAQVSGELKLSGRNLKSFPRRHSKASPYFLRDTVSADLSRNKLNEVPEECIKFGSMEKFLLYHNTIKSIPDSIIQLHSLQFLDLSRNQLSYLPANLCMLPLQCLIVNNNRLVSLPEEIGKMQTLMELDASCNEIAHLPVQIGDLSSLKCLKLRRNHLQEIPVEISYLQLSTLDLSGNRISVLPVELRFMTTVIDLNLEENPLTCPPANLCSRGRIHIYKYLEIQAIKEDRRRGVLTDSDYRRSYRKTGSTQLSDLGFNNMFHCDPRRKRNTADSGYGSEQPLERRWSQDFNQEMQDFHHPHPEEGKRLILKAAAAANSMSRCGSSNKAPPSEKKIPPPLQASSGSSASSSGYNSLSGGGGSLWENSGCLGSPDLTIPLEAKGPSGFFMPPPPDGSFHKMMDGLGISNHKNTKTGGDFVDSPPTQENKAYNQNLSGRNGVEASSSHLPLQSSNSARPNSSKLPSPRHSYMPSYSSPAVVAVSSSSGCTNSVGGAQRYSSGITVSPPRQQVNGSGLPLPSKMTLQRAGGGASEIAQQSKIHSQTYRQFKEQLRIQRNSDMRNGSDYSPTESSPGEENSRFSNGTSTLKASSSKTNGGPYSYDVKTMQKEALLSFVKSKASRQGEKQTVQAPSSNSNSGIPQPSLNTNRLSRMTLSNGGAPLETPPVRTFAARREAEKSASSEAHIHQLKLHLENRLRLTLPDDISGSLVDGVILCHMANHVKPRSVPSIHVPSPAVPKLTSAKCRKNVENFLLACRKIGVRDEDLFDWDNLVPLPDFQRIYNTLLALEDTLYSPPEKEDPGANTLAAAHYPDLVPLEETTNILRLAHSQSPGEGEPTNFGVVLSKDKNNESSTTTTTNIHKSLESCFLSLLLLGTTLLLYVYPPSDVL